MDVYQALADSTRRLLLDELSQRDEQTLFELCSRLAVHHAVTSTRQAVSQHLAALESVGLVRSERRGRHKFHSIDTTPLAAITDRWPLPEDVR
ncbi:helix-turn-helix domain-containing protein [Kineococcus endophyticus]|uniref:Helix-turn-helix domain-containing protein n=1 Tax=Kineococcus endophyticus TaxID=1181883 RepID=A0ABV3PBV4_9ACTN